MSPARDLPDEIVLHIFEDVADRQPDVFDLRHRCAGQVYLACLARVCRRWAPIAQALLFTEICVVPRRTNGDVRFAFSAEQSSQQLAATLQSHSGSEPSTWACPHSAPWRLGRLLSRHSLLARVRARPTLEVAPAPSPHRRGCCGMPKSSTPRSYPRL